MSGRPPCKGNQAGFTLLEALIAFVILTVGLLGTVALQAKAKQASFDALQRSAALALGTDIMQRIRVNDVQSVATLYQMEFNTLESPSAVDCFSQVCSAAELASHDKNQWLAAIKARENSGSLDDATVCISTVENAGAITKSVDIEVIVAWRGRQTLNGGDSTKVCGSYGDKRRMLVFNSTVHLRA